MPFNPEIGPSAEEPEQQVEKKEQEPKPHFDAVIVFGGPLNIPETEKQVIEFSEEENKQLLDSIPEKDDENYQKWLNWRKQARTILTVETKMRALAGLEVLKNSDTDKIIITGGKFENGKNLSEAGLMRDFIAQTYQQELKRKVVKKEITEQQALNNLRKKIERIQTEEDATNTVENFADTLNKIIDKDKAKYQSMALLSSFYHLPRIAEIAKKFRVKGETESAEKHIAKRSKHYTELISKTFYTDVNPDNPKNIAARPQDLIINPDYLKKIKAETKWQGGMKELLLYWLPQAVTVNPERLEQMMQENEELKDLSLEDVSYMLSLPKEERNKLREMPPEEWADLEAILPPKQPEQ